MCRSRMSPASLFSIGLILIVLSRFTTAAADGPPRGYAIPLIDLAGQTQRQTVVDREPGQYLGHPTTVLLEDGKTVLIVYPKGHGRGAIVRKKSLDGGRSWSTRLPVPENWATSQETPTIHRVTDAQGVKRLIVFSGLYPIRMAVSEDDGDSWSDLKPIGDYGGIVAMGSVVELRNGKGRYMALFHDDGRFISKDRSKSPAGFHVYKVVSTDGGLSWSAPRIIASHPSAHLCEPGAIRSPDGKQLAVLLRENSRKHNSFVIFSNDEGETWSLPRELPGALTGDRHVARYAPDGRLFVTFRDTTLESPTKGDWVAWVGMYDDIVNGREGQYRVRLMKNHKGADCAYPGLELLPDGALLTTTYGHWTPGEPPYIVSVRFTMRELDALAISNSPKASGAWRWTPLPSLPDPLGFAGSYAGAIEDALVVAGGSNFPEKPVWENGKKVWYDHVYVLDRPDGSWRKAGCLPGPRGYGVSISTSRGLICIGGSDADRHYAEVFRLSLSNGELQTSKMPPLPRPCANYCGAILGDVIYVAGGIETPDATEGLRTFWALDLADPKGTWKSLPPWPGPGRMLATAAVFEGAFYLAGGTNLYPGTIGLDGKPRREYLRDAYRYVPNRGWSPVAPLPAAVVASPTPAATSLGGFSIFGGDDGAFVGYLPMQSHPGFPSRIFTYSPQSDSWTTSHGIPTPPQIVTSQVSWRGGFVLPLGEIRPGIRSTAVWFARYER